MHPLGAGMAPVPSLLGGLFLGWSRYVTLVANPYRFSRSVAQEGL
jgi:hypothetical protein